MVKHFPKILGCEEKATTVHDQQKRSVTNKKDHVSNKKDHVTNKKDSALFDLSELHNNQTLS